METFRRWMELAGTGIDGLGVLVIVVGVLSASFRFLMNNRFLSSGANGAPAAETPFRIYRQSVGRSILLGLEFLVAGDIIRTVVVAPTIQNVAALGLIVLIRTFLSVSLQVELEGTWPWQRKG